MARGRTSEPSGGFVRRLIWTAFVVTGSGALVYGGHPWIALALMALQAAFQAIEASLWQKSSKVLMQAANELLDRN